MARFEADREDLLREARKLVERVEMEVAGFNESVVAGFRDSGAMSIYLGADAVLQFNVMHQWRRGYRNDRMFKADRGKIVQLTRQREPDSVNLVRHDLSDVETAEFVETLQQQITALRKALEQGRYKIIGQVPQDADIINRLRRGLDQLSNPITIARRPNV